MSLPTSGFYSNIISSYFGYLTPTDQQDLWNQFLKKNGLTTNPSDTDPNAQLEFVDFMQSHYSNVQIDLQLSPAEVEKRRIMFDAFSIVLHMLTVLQNTVTTQSNNLVFLGKWQEEYTKMMTKVPIYVGTPSQTVKVDLTNPSKFTLGYNDISIQDVADYVATTGQTAQLELFSSFTAPGSADNTSVYATITPTNITFELIARAPAVPPIFAGGAFYSSGPITFPVTAGGTTSSEIAASIAKTFTNSFSIDLYSLGAPPYTPVVSGSPIAPLTISQFMNTNPLLGSTMTPAAIQGVPWRLATPNTGDFSSLTQDEKDANSNVAKTRAEINTRNQQYIENLRSRRDTIRDQASVVENNVSTTKEAISQQAALLNSIIESLKGIIAAIYK